MIIECRDLCKDYYIGKSPVPILKNISFQMDEGEFIAIMGPSGSGKTTLMNLIGCLDTPTSGSLLLNGQEVGDLKESRLAELRNRTLGFVFQNAELMSDLSALDNVALPLLYRGVRKKERRECAAAVLEKVGLAERVNYRPNQLSGGQRQRVAIARAIVGEPKLLLADEPTGALDSKSGRQVIEIFHRLHDEGSTILMITHDQNIALEAERILYIRDGILSDKPSDNGEVISV